MPAQDISASNPTSTQICLMLFAAHMLLYKFYTKFYSYFTPCTLHI